MVRFVIVVVVVFFVSYVQGGPSYIRLNQSCSKKQHTIQKSIQQQHTTIMNKLADDLHRQHCLPKKANILKEFSEQLHAILNRTYYLSRNYQDVHRSKAELKLVLSIQRKLKRFPIILRPSDKTGVLHIGYRTDYERKVEQYQMKTKAYVELSSNPLVETYDKVIRLLNDLNSKKQILVWQYNRMKPDRSKIQIAYLYFLPKPHKVIIFDIDFCVLMFVVCICLLFFSKSRMAHH